MTMQAATSRGLLGTAVGASGALGAVVGGVVATAQDVGRVQKGEMNKAEAVVDISKEAVGTGLSTAAGVAVVGVLGVGGLLGLAGILGVAAGTKYLWDKQFGHTTKTKAIEA